MTWKNPWAISGVDEITLDVARVLAFTATGGAEGVVASTDLKVAPLGTPGGSVTVGKGAFSCLNRFAAGSSESYIGYNDGAVSVTVPATSGTERYDMVYAKITDPGQPNNPVSPLPVQTLLIQGVPSTATKLSDVPGYTNVAGYALARLRVPASTSAITASMITDLRNILQPKTTSLVRVYNVPSGESTQLTSATQAAFPPNATWNIDIPVWATRMTVTAWASGLEVRGTTTQEFQGWFRAKAGSVYTDASYINAGLTAGT